MTPASTDARSATPAATLIHELRQPLSTIETCAVLLREMLEDIADPRITENLDCIERQVAEAHRILLEAAASRSLTNSESAGGA